MTEGTVHVVGAGLAGLSAAVCLTRRGRRVVIHEANRFAGGRCRTFRDARLGCEIDNGNHLLLSGNRSARAYLQAIGADGRMIELPARFPFVELASGRCWTLDMEGVALPLWLLSRRLRVPGTRAADYLAALRLAVAGADRTVADALPRRGPAWHRFWVPLTLAAINAPPERASARLLWAVLRETFARGAAACRPMLAPRGLGHALVEPAVGWLTAHGVRIELARQLRRVEAEAGHATVLRFADGDEMLGPADRVILALPPSRLRAVLPGAAPPDDACAIVNAFFRLPAPLPEAPPILGVLSATAQWIFLRGDVASVTVSAGDALGVADEPGEELIPTIWAEVRRALGLGPGARYLAARINKERRATFDQSPAGVARRLGARTPLANLFLAGDATDTGLPATIEGAIRSGETAAALAR
jgi:squalene-associated FAD-dependent desaturase